MKQNNPSCFSDQQVARMSSIKPDHGWLIRYSNRWKGSFLLKSLCLGNYECSKSNEECFKAQDFKTLFLLPCINLEFLHPSVTYSFSSMSLWDVRAQISLFFMLLALIVFSIPMRHLSIKLPRSAVLPELLQTSCRSC